jgi:predicted MarR family transcription regulator
MNSQALTFPLLVPSAHAAVKRHPGYSEHEYLLAVEAAFAQWEAMQNVGR